MIRVLIAEDSPTLRDLLVHVLESDPDIRVVGAVGNGEEAVGAARRLKPDVVTMDVHMPKMNGFEATRTIMATQPVPIVVISSTLKDQVAATFEALEAGALAFVRQPSGPLHDTDHEADVAELLKTIKSMAEVKLVRRWARAQGPAPLTRAAGRELRIAPADIGVIAVGASTGGPVVLQRILSELAKGLSVPVLIVQHIAAGFSQGLAEWLGRSCNLPVEVAGDGVPALPGHVYLAPDDAHMGMGQNNRISISRGPAENGLRPAVSFLFRSVAKTMGPHAVGILLTGMGRDGARELKLMKDRGAVTIAQDEQSSIVHGMPGEAVRLDAAGYVLSPEEIVTVLAGLLRREEPGP